MVSSVLTPPATATTPSATAPSAAAAASRTIWGLDAFALYARFWAAHGVQVVRQAEPPRIGRMTRSVDGNAYLQSSPRAVSFFVHDLLQIWKQPNSTIARAQHGLSEMWQDPAAQIDAAARFIGPVWVGAGRKLPAGTTV